MTARIFPDGFLWGVATSAYQIEGGDPRGRARRVRSGTASPPSPGDIADGSDGSVACDHYHRWREDLGADEAAGRAAPTASPIAWPRVMPRGRGAVNAAGLDFYDALVDGLLEAGIRPFVTLYHWDLPAGAPGRAAAGPRARHRRGLRRLRRGRHACGSATGSATGSRTTSPGASPPWATSRACTRPAMRDPAEALRAAHHLLLSHGWAVAGAAPERARRRGRHRPEPGARLPGLAERRPTATPPAASTARFNRWYLDPLFRGSYPPDAVEDRVRDGATCRAARCPASSDGDLRGHRRAARLPGDQLLQPGRPAQRPDPRGRERRRAPSPRTRRRRAPTWAGRSSRRGSTTCSCGSTGSTGRRAIYVTENGAAYDDGPAPTAASATPGASTSCASTCWRPTGPSPTASRWPATSCGPCSTTSSGRTATPSASAWSGSTAGPSERIPKDSALWYRDVDRRQCGRGRRAPSVEEARMNPSRSVSRLRAAPSPGRSLAAAAPGPAPAAAPAAAARRPPSGGRDARS